MFSSKSFFRFISFAFLYNLYRKNGKTIYGSDQVMNSKSISRFRHEIWLEEIQGLLFCKRVRKIGLDEVWKSYVVMDSWKNFGRWLLLLIVITSMHQNFLRTFFDISRVPGVSLVLKWIEPQLTYRHLNNSGWLVFSLLGTKELGTGCPVNIQIKLWRRRIMYMHGHVYLILVIFP